MSRLFFRQSEVNLIKRDFEDLIRSPETVAITVEYAVYADESSTNVDSVYGVEDRVRASAVKTRSLQCIQQIISERHTKLLSTGFLQVGDAIHYFSNTVDFQNFDLNEKDVVEGTLVFIDPSGQRWFPNPSSTRGLKNFAMFLMNNTQISQAVVTSLENR